MRVREISDDDGNRLKRIVRRGSGSVVTWRRAQMVLWSAQGMSAAHIAGLAFTSEDRVRDVLHNFNADGFDAYNHHPRRAARKGRRSAQPDQADQADQADQTDQTEPQLPPDEREALQHALARPAIHVVSRPGAIASALRRSLLGAPLNTRSVILDVG